MDAPSSRAGTTVLIVDDNEAIRSVMERLLRIDQIEALLAADLEAAEFILRQRDDIQVLLADLVLADGQTGPDVVRRAMELRPDIRCAYIR
jgi:DNA-binding NtrC family response regulator